jgi:hypothetical protein
MREVLSAPEALVLDDFLEPSTWDFLWAQVQADDFEHVHRLGWVKAWRLSDGVPLRGPVTLSNPTAADRITPVYPTGLATDLLIARILEIEQDLTSWVGSRGEDWSHFFCRPYIYPTDTGLSWHRDNQFNTTGAFTYYCHRDWNVQWGGELLVADAKTKNLNLPETQLFGDGEAFIGTHLDNLVENRALLEDGNGRFIFPKPNRLVVVPAGVLHAIKKVDASAGSSVRVSFQGTFMNVGSSGMERSSRS